MIFDPPSEALEFLRLGGVVTLGDWAGLDPADKLALRVARETLAETAQIAAEGAQLAAAFRGVARAVAE